MSAFGTKWTLSHLTCVASPRSRLSTAARMTTLALGTQIIWGMSVNR